MKPRVGRPADEGGGSRRKRHERQPKPEFDEQGQDRDDEHGAADPARPEPCGWQRCRRGGVAGRHHPQAGADDREPRKGQQRGHHRVRPHGRRGGCHAGTIEAVYQEGGEFGGRPARCRAHALQRRAVPPAADTGSGRCRQRGPRRPATDPGEQRQARPGRPRGGRRSGGGPADRRSRGRRRPAANRAESTGLRAGQGSRHGASRAHEEGQARRRPGAVQGCVRAQGRRRKQHQQRPRRCEVGGRSASIETAPPARSECAQCAQPGQAVTVLPQDRAELGRATMASHGSRPRPITPARARGGRPARPRASRRRQRRIAGTVE